MTLRQHGREPGAELAAAVEVAEQRLTDAVALAQSVEVGVERIGEIARAAGRIDRVRGAIERRDDA